MIANGIRSIAVVQPGDGDGDVAQALLREVAARLAPAVRVAGLVETPGRGRNSSRKLRCLTGGELFPLFQDLGSGSSGCALDNGSLVLAGEAARRGIAAGCDIAILSKFAKAEAEKGSGLLPAFAAAIEADVPVLTSVAPKFMPAWSRFASPMFETMEARIEVVLAWWEAVRRRSAD